MKVCIMGTCRVCLTDILSKKKKKRFYLKKYINYHIVGHNSKVYIYMNKNNKKVRIHTQPITYTTKLADVMNCLEYLQGNNYNIDPNEDINFFKIFFRGFNKKAFNEKLLIKPNQKIEGDNNNYNMYIFEICSIREIIFNTDKYGEEYKNKNLNWNIDVVHHNTINFDKDDFKILHNDISRTKETLKKINILCKEKPILLIGPYLLKNDMLEYNDNLLKFEKNDLNINNSNINNSNINNYVNQCRKDVQDIIEEIINDYDNIEYFDMTEYVINDDILVDQYHFNEKGNDILSNYILNWIDSKS